MRETKLSKFESNDMAFIDKEYEKYLRKYNIQKGSGFIMMPKLTKNKFINSAKFYLEAPKTKKSKKSYIDMMIREAHEVTVGQSKAWGKLLNNINILDKLGLDKNDKKYKQFIQNGLIKSQAFRKYNSLYEAFLKYIENSGGFKAVFYGD